MTLTYEHNCNHMSAFIHYPNPPEGGGPVTMTALHSSKDYWFTNLMLSTGGHMTVKWRRPWDGAFGHGYQRAISVDSERREVEFTNGRFVLFVKNPDGD